MSFIWPGMLLLLLSIPLFVLLYTQMLNRRRAAVASNRSGLLQRALGQQPGLRRHIPPLLFLISITILIIALARPKTVVSLPRIEGVVVLAFDVSGSMAADDLKPTRMEAAKAAAQDFVQHQPTTVLIGVVAFSDSGLSVQVPTRDQAAVLAAINRLSPQRGTSLANGIIASLDAIAVAASGQNTRYYSNVTATPAPTPTPMPAGTFTSGVIVLLTDGDNNEQPDPLAAAKAATDRGVRIHTVGIGSVAGTTVRINGFTLHTQLDEAMLQQIAQMTNGTYYNAESDQDLLNIYDNLNPQLVIKPEETEVTAIFAGVSILMLLIGGIISLLWFGRLP
jgi:Ca-activated chloride channel family protein